MEDRPKSRSEVDATRAAGAAARVSQAAPFLSDPDENLTIDQGSSRWSEIAQGAKLGQELQPGTVLGGRYEILEMLGVGGMGAVYKARDKEVERLVALKVIRPELAGKSAILQRFKQELVLAHQVTHRNVIRIYDLGEADGIKFITMEYIKGETLSSVLRRRGKVPPREAALIIQQVCIALAAAHAEGVIHRDLKPGNIMLGRNGRVLVMDFGLAHSLESGPEPLQDDGTVTMPVLPYRSQPGMISGTVGYMSPEQALGEGVDERSDIYSLGIAFYELLVGRRPQPRKSTAEKKLIRGKVTSVEEVEPGLPHGLTKIVNRCLEPKRELRYQSVKEVLHDLDWWLAPLWRRSWKWAAAAAVVLVLVVIQIAVEPRFRSVGVAQHSPVSVLVADFKNETSDSIFDGTLEPAFGVALEGASFITGYNRGSAHKLAARLQPGAVTLDDTLARLVATREGINVVVSGDISRKGDKYALQIKALDSSTGKTLVTAEEATDKDDVLLTIGKLAARVRKQLGDTTPQSAQLAAAETFSSKSLDAAHEYAVAQDLQLAGKWDDAIAHYLKAAQLDPDLGRAYVGLGNAYHNTGQTQQAEKYYQLALSKIDRMSDREKYRTRGAYYLLIRDTDKAIEQQVQLVKQYPADTAGIANLALAYFYRRDMARSLEEGRKALAIYPQNLLFRNNVGLFAMYAGEFDQAIKEQSAVIQTNASFVLGYVGLALSELGDGHPEKATEAYQKLESLGAQGASSAPAGLADVALYEGRLTDAINILEKGARTDIVGKNPDGAATKLAILSQAYLLKGDAALAVHAAGRALEQSKDTEVTFWAARTYIGANQPAKALASAKQLADRLEPDPQAYAKLIEGEVELKTGKPREAIKLFLESRKIADTWMGRFDAGRAYVDAGAFAEAESDLDVCLKRRGEATALFLDENPTYFAFPPVYYYLARAQQGLKSAAAADSYKTFLSMKQKSESDILVSDAKKRVGR